MLKIIHNIPFYIKVYFQFLMPKVLQQIDKNKFKWFISNMARDQTIKDIINIIIMQVLSCSTTRGHHNPGGCRSCVQACV